MTNLFEHIVLRHLIRWHGLGASHQFMYYRCRGCRSIVTHKAIAKGGCTCEKNELSPAILSFLDKFKLIFLPWAVRR